MSQRLRFRLLWLILLIGIAGTQVISTTVSAAANEPVWVPFARGADYTWMPYYTAASKRFKGNIFVVRIAPDSVLFRIYYHPGQRQTVARWAAEYPGAFLVVNASFFDRSGRPIGLVRIGDDILRPATTNPESGQFTVANEIPEIGPLVKDEKPGTGYSESFESHPLLIANGQIVQFADNPSARNRRTILAKDTQGNVLIMFTSSVELSLTESAQWLQDSGLNVITALNLDGNGSSQLHIRASGDFSQLVQGYAAVPVVLAVFPRR